MTDIDLIIEGYNPRTITEKLIANFKKARISKQLSQVGLAQKANIALSSVKRFEQTGVISVSKLILLAIALDEVDGIIKLFANQVPATLDDFLSNNNLEGKKRVRKP